MRNMLLAYAALGLLAVASSANAQSSSRGMQSVQGMQNAAAATMQGAQSTVTDAVVGSQGMHDHSAMQPMSQQNGMIHSDGAMIQSDGAVSYSDGAMIQSNGSMVHSDGAMIHSDGAMMAQSYPVEQYQSVGQPVSGCCQQHAVVAKKQGPLQKLLELERKKNAWLRRTFLGRE